MQPGNNSSISQDDSLHSEERKEEGHKTATDISKYEEKLKNLEKQYKATNLLPAVVSILLNQFPDDIDETAFPQAKRDEALYYICRAYLVRSDYLPSKNMRILDMISRLVKVLKANPAQSVVTPDGTSESVSEMIKRYATSGLYNQKVSLLISTILPSEYTYPLYPMVVSIFLNQFPGDVNQIHFPQEERDRVLYFLCRAYLDMPYYRSSKESSTMEILAMISRLVQDLNANPTQKMINLDDTSESVLEMIQRPTSHYDYVKITQLTKILGIKYNPSAQSGSDSHPSETEAPKETDSSLTSTSSNPNKKMVIGLAIFIITAAIITAAVIGALTFGFGFPLSAAFIAGGIAFAVPLVSGILTFATVGTATGSIRFPCFPPSNSRPTTSITSVEERYRNNNTPDSTTSQTRYKT